MMMWVRFGVFAAVLAATTAVCGCAAFEGESQAIKRQLMGTWVTSVVEREAPGDGMKAFVRQTLVFTAESERLMVEAFADEALQQKIFIYDWVGPFIKARRSASIAGVYDVDFENDRSDMTIFVDAPPIWKALNLQSCALKVGIAVDISKCSEGPPFQVTDCTDMDLVAVSGDGRQLRMGEPGFDRCLQRPTRLGKLIFNKK